MKTLPNRFPEEVEAAREALLLILKTSMDTVVERSLRNPAYPWIDTKFSLLDGRDFDEEDPIRGRDTVYAWIQGRGLEALAEHLRFFEARGLLDAEGSKRYRRVLRATADALVAARKRGKGHLFFSLTKDGEAKATDESGRWKPHALAEASPYNLSDLFCSRGLYAASRVLADAELEKSARDYCRLFRKAVLEGRYETDQQQFDPKNAVRPVPGRISHAPSMLQIPTFTLFLRAGEGSGTIREGLDLIQGILARHVNEEGRFPGLAASDFVEFLGEDGMPFDGKALSDPGHALEFTGLASRFCAEVEARCKDSGTLAETAAIRKKLLGVFKRSFTLGFEPVHGGIMKLLDLDAGERLNADMPWWSLPETMRAALEGLDRGAGEEDKIFLKDAFHACGNALLEHYVSRKAGLFCVQTRDAQGRVVATIPAVPDADPGYHTGLSLLRCVELLS